MTFATFSLEKIISDKILSMPGLTLSFVIAVLGKDVVSETSAREGLLGTRRLSTEKLQRILEVVTGIEQIVQSVAPIPCAFRGPDLWRELINERRERGAE